MKYILRPAWRSQWGLLTLAIVLLVIPFLPLAESIESGNLRNSLDTANEGALLAVFGVPVMLIFLIMVYRHLSWRFMVGDGNIESRHGMIAREVRSVRIEDVRSIDVKQSLLDRLLFIGDIEFSSAGTAGIEVVFRRVGRPLAIKRYIENLR